MGQILKNVLETDALAKVRTGVPVKDLQVLENVEADLKALARAQESAVATEEAVGEAQEARPAKFELTFKPLVRGLEVRSDGSQVRVDVEEMGGSIKLRVDW